MISQNLGAFSDCPLDVRQKPQVHPILGNGNLVGLDSNAVAQSYSDAEKIISSRRWAGG